MSMLKKSISMPDYQSTSTKKLWQIFFDDNKAEGESSVRPKSVTIDKSGRHHGVLYQGLMDVDTDSDDELPPKPPKPPRATSTGIPDDTESASRETVLFEKSAIVHNSNSVVNHQFNAKKWESIDIQPGPRFHSQRLGQDGGARFVIRSESDLELAIPTGKRKKGCGCYCFPSGKSQSEKFEYGTCVFLALITMVAVYVAIVICIVYGFK